MLYNEAENRFGPAATPSGSSPEAAGGEGSSDSSSNPPSLESVSDQETSDNSEALLDTDSSGEGRELQAGCAAFKIPVVTGIGRIPRDQLVMKI